MFLIINCTLFLIVLSQEHDSGDRIPAVYGAAASFQGSKAMVGCVYRLSVCDHAHDRRVWVHSAGSYYISFFIWCCHGSAVIKESYEN